MARGRASKTAAPPVPLETPNAGELDVYSVLYAEDQGDKRSLQLSEVYRRVCERRRRFAEPEPALTTVSTHLRGLVRKGLAAELTAGPGLPARPNPRMRGAATPPTRSPLTSYRVRHTPGDVLRSTFQGLAAVYPDRLDALLDFARALELSDEGMRSSRN